MIDSVWYGRGAGARIAAALLLPLAVLFGLLTAARRALYRIGWLRSHAVGVPVIVVGNISVGGVGKTPLVVHLVERAQALGLTPGVVSRGYGGAPGKLPLMVTPQTPPAQCGDEPRMVAERTGAAVCVHPDRVAAARRLVEQGVDCIIADDGLQHYRLARDAEIAVVDATRGLGNGLLLPAGPLREPQRRLRSVDVRVVRGGVRPGALTMHVRGEQLIPLHGGKPEQLADWATRKVHAVAGIGNPARFFEGLHLAGLHVTPHAFPDHYGFAEADFDFDDGRPLIMTEKDAVKCSAFAKPNWWVLPVSAVFRATDAQVLDDILRRVCN